MEASGECAFAVRPVFVPAMWKVLKKLPFRVLLFSALYPPHVLGGAENSARNLAEWLRAQGVDVGVVRATDEGEAPGEDVTPTGIRIWRVETPHIYSTVRFPSAPAWKKPIWHLQDHLDPRIRKPIGAVLDQFKPDLVNVHILQGLGYPALLETARRRIPVNYVLPDLGLACVRMSMFRRGKDCVQQCTGCRLSSWYKSKLVQRQEEISFVSPSHANLETLSRFFPVRNYRSTSILNPNAYPKPRVERSSAPGLRLLYAGRIHESKGVDLLLQAVDRLADRHAVTLSIAGKGQQEAELRETYGGKPWCRFLGFLSQGDLADEMMRSDLLCIPSIWAENSPGVVIQALGLGLPVLGSNWGGIPELVHDGENGRLVTESTADAWAVAIENCILHPEELEQWRAKALAQAQDFDQDAIGARLLAWMKETAFRGRIDGVSPTDAPS